MAWLLFVILVHNPELRQQKWARKLCLATLKVLLDNVYSKIYM